MHVNPCPTVATTGVMVIGVAMLQRLKSHTFFLHTFWQDIGNLDVQRCTCLERSIYELRQALSFKVGLLAVSRD